MPNSYISTKTDFPEQLELLVNKHLSSVKLDNTFLANQLYMSEARLYRLVKHHYKISPNTFVRRARLRAAFDLLSSGNCPTVKEAAFQVGFTHVGYFIRRFEEFYGQTPGSVEKREQGC